MPPKSRGAVRLAAKLAERSAADAIEAARLLPDIPTRLSVAIGLETSASSTSCPTVDAAGNVPRAEACLSPSDKAAAQLLKEMLPFYNLGAERDALQFYAVDRGSTCPYAIHCPISEAEWANVINGSQACAASRHRDRERCPYVGLRNCGATCYVNSLLQYLYVNAAFRKCVIEAQPRPQGDEILSALQLLFGRMLRGNERVCDPTDFVDRSGLAHGEQEDITELWQLLRNYLVVRIGGGQGGIERLLSFQQMSSVECAGCCRASERIECLHELHVKLRPVAAQETSAADSKRGVQPASIVNLEDELFAGFSEERFEGQNQYNCEICGGLRDATQTCWLQTLPPFLHVVIDRFCWDTESGERQKLCHEICFPQLLDVSSLVKPAACGAFEDPSPPAVFELIGVLEHHSQSVDHGHYTATLRQPRSAAQDNQDSCGTWWKFNDSNVTEMVSPGKEMPNCAEHGAAVDGENGPNAGEARLCEGKRWASASAYMLAYRQRRPWDGSDVYAEPEIMDLPESIKQVVDESNAKLRREDQDHDKVVGAKMAFLINRREDAAALLDEIETSVAKAASRGATIASQLSVVPAPWLRQWQRGEEVDGCGDGQVRVDYSGILLPASDGGKPKLDPFAMWDGKAKVVPTDVLKDFIIDTDERTLVLQPSVIRGGEGLLSLEDVSFASLASSDACRAIQGLHRCHRELQTLIHKIASTDAAYEVRTAPPTSEFVYVRKTVITQINRRIGGHSLETRRKPKLSASALWADLRDERAKTRPLPLADLGVAGNGGQCSRSQKRRVSADAPPALELGEGLCCPHGQIVPQYPHIAAYRRDIDRMVELLTARSSHWRVLGRNVPVDVRADNLIPWPHEICPTCKEALQDEKKRKRQENKCFVERKNDLRRFPHLSKQSFPVESKSSGSLVHLQPGTYALIPSSWQRAWRAFMTTQDAPQPSPLDVACASLGCKHGKLLYDAEKYFQNRLDGFPEGEAHPHSAAYGIVPEREASLVAVRYGNMQNGVRTGGSGSSTARASAPWCTLQCSKYESGTSVVRAFESKPAVCPECSPAAEDELVARREMLKVKLHDVRLTGEPGGKAMDLQIRCRKNSSGAHLKEQIITASKFEGVKTGQLLLSLVESSKSQKNVGDADRIDMSKYAKTAHASSSSASGTSPPYLIAELFPVDLCDPEPEAPLKRARTSAPSSLLASQLARPDAFVPDATLATALAAD